MRRRLPALLVLAVIAAAFILGLGVRDRIPVLRGARLWGSSLRLVGGDGDRRHDPLAFAPRVLELDPAAQAQAWVLPGHGDLLQIRARSDACGRSRLAITIDGHPLAVVPLEVPNWLTYTVLVGNRTKRSLLSLRDAGPSTRPCDGPIGIDELRFDRHAYELAPNRMRLSGGAALLHDSDLELRERGRGAIAVSLPSTSAVLPAFRTESCHGSAELRISIDSQIVSMPTSGPERLLARPIVVPAGEHSVKVAMTARNGDSRCRVLLHGLAFVWSEKSYGAAGAPPPTYIGSFDGGSFSDWQRLISDGSELPATPAGRTARDIRLLPAPALGGAEVAAFTARPGAPELAGDDAVRTTVAADGPESGALPNLDTWYGWEVKFPRSFESGSNAPYIDQVKRLRGACGAPNIVLTVDSRPAGVDPGYAGWLRLFTQGGFLPGNADLRRPSNDCPGIVTRSFDVARYRPDHWYQVVLHVHWSDSRSRGFVEMWVDGRQVLERTREPTLYNDSAGGYWEEGVIAKAPTVPLTVYQSALRVGPSYPAVDPAAPPPRGFSSRR